MEKKLKYFEVKRVIEEVYHVYAHTKVEAKLNIQDPSKITVRKERIRELKNNKPL